MKWSWRIGQVAGIGIYVHFTFLILLGWLGLMYLQRGESVGVALKGIGFVTVHQLGSS